MDENFGIYIDVIKTNEKVSDTDNHALYQATCSVCGEIVKKRLYDLTRFNKKCTHKTHKNTGALVYGIEGTKDTKNIPLNSDYNTRVYDLWRHMLYRTTDAFQEKYPTYKGTTVCEEWYDFGQFYEDIKSLNGYALWKDNYGKRIMLDKDLLGNRSKLYCKENCCFLTPKESNDEISDRYENLHHTQKCEESRLKIKQSKGRKIKLINLETKEEKYFLSIKDCAKFLNTNPRNVYMCISKKEKYKSMKTLKGWELQEILPEDN